MSPRRRQLALPSLQKHRHLLLLVFLLGAAGWFWSRTLWFHQQPDLLPAPHERPLLGIDFTLSDLHGRTWRLADLRGQPVLLNLWATWCYPCRVEMPSLQALYQTYREQNLVILAVASDRGGRDDVEPFVQEHALTFPVLLDQQNVLGAQLKVSGIPTTYLLDRAGRVVALEVGVRDWNSRRVRRLVAQLLAESSQASEVSRTAHAP